MNFALKRLNQIAFRLKLFTGFDRAFLGLGMGLSAAILCLVLSKFILISYLSFILIGLLSGGVVIGFLVGFGKSYSLISVAAYLDKVADTKEVVTTAYEYALQQDNSPGTLWNLQRAEQVLGSVKANRVCSYRLPSLKWYYAGLPILLLALYLIPPLNLTAGTKPSVKVASHHIRNLSKVSRHIKKLTQFKTNKQLLSLSLEIQRLTQKAKAGKIEKKQALKRLDELKEKARKLNQEMRAREQTLKILKGCKETKSMAEAFAKRDLKAMEKALKELKDRLLGNKFDPRQLELLQKRLKELAEGLSEDSLLKEKLQEICKLLQGKNLGKLAEKLKELLGKELGELTEWDGIELDELEVCLEELLGELEEIEGDILKIAKGKCKTCTKHGILLGKNGKCAICQKQGSILAGGDSTNEGPEKSGPAHPGVSHDEGGTDVKETKDWEKLYAPVKLEPKRISNILSKRKITGQGQVLTMKFKGAPNKKEEAMMPLSEALPVYKEAAERALTEGAIPPEYQEQVKRYFEALDRQRKKTTGDTEK